MDNVDELAEGNSEQAKSIVGGKPQRLVRLAEVKQRVGLSRASI
jgi:hypothetical protein